MRDIIWTVIIVWVVWKIYNAFFNTSKGQKPTRKEGEIKIDRQVNTQSRFNPNDGEYVEYEEIK